MATLNTREEVEGGGGKSVEGIVSGQRHGALPCSQMWAGPEGKTCSCSLRGFSNLNP